MFFFKSNFFLLGGSASKDGQVLYSTKGLKDKNAIGTIAHPEKIGGNKTEPCWKWLNDFAENFVLENIPFLSFCFMILIMICQAVTEVAEEWEIDCLLFIPVLLAGFVLYIKRKTIHIQQK